MMIEKTKKIVIIGAGPAGLTAGYELLKEGFTDVIILEQKDFVGGLATSAKIDGNIIDMGGHRYFTKSKEVLSFWNEILPFTRDSEGKRDVMLIVDRSSHIFYNNNFFEYPMKINFDAVKKLGFIETFLCGISYLFSMWKSPKNIKTLEDFMIKNFGRRLYLKFFKPYSEKVWGKPPSEIPSDWAAQRIKKVSIFTMLWNVLALVGGKKQVSLTDYFYYPKFGSVHFWEKTLEKFLALGGRIHYNQDVSKINLNGDKIVSLEAIDKSGKSSSYEGDVFISTMPIKNLYEAMSPEPELLNVASKLSYRDWIGLWFLVPKKDVILAKDDDQWIYMQEGRIKVGRLEIFNNWSKAMVQNEKENYSFLLEYFADEGDKFWNMAEDDFMKFGLKEMIDIKFLKEGSKFLLFKEFKVKKAYPSYFGSYEEFPKIKEHLTSISNLLPIGRNGMHRYNNSDHSALCGIRVVQYLLGKATREDVWSVNEEQEYHETEKSGS